MTAERRPARVAAPSGSWWRSLSRLPAGLIAVAGLGEVAAGHSYPVPLLGSVLDVVAPAGVLVATTILYQLVIRWNRMVAGSADPGDWLNGLGGVLVGAAIGNALFGDTDVGSPAAFVAGQLEMLAVGATLVLIGACVSVAMLARLWRDVRFWLIMASACCLMLSSLLVLLPGRTVWCGLGCLVAAGMVLLCHHVPDVPSEPVPASLQATSSGSIIVMGLAVVVLALSPFLGSRQPVATVYAGLVIPIVGTRLVRLVRDLEILTRARVQALTDDLTGIANRRSLLADLRSRLDRGEAVAMVLLDLNDFKLVNDRYGHGVGDDVLREVSQVFQAQLPRRVSLARLGGDEFAVLLPGGTDDEALALGRLLVEAPGARAELGGRALRIRASAGVASSARAAAGPSCSASELMRRADTAMYQAKSSGDGVAVYDAALDARAREQQDLIEELHELLTPGSSARQQMLMFFQPQLDVADGTPVGAEALVRWWHPRLGLLTPDRFLDLVEREGLMMALTGRVLEVAAVQWRRLHAQGSAVRVSVNLSASCLGRPELLGLLDDVIAGGADPTAFVLEVTETAVMSDPDQALGMIKAIAGRGFQISIDDYGTGYSSLSYLNDLPASELKIDRSFVRRLAADHRTAAIVAGTVDLAHRLGMRLVAEGVEDGATLAILRRLGCDESQGYLHARPMPAAELETWLRSRSPAAAEEPIR